MEHILGLQTYRSSCTQQSCSLHQCSHRSTNLALQLHQGACQSCSLIECNVEVSFIRSFYFSSLFEGFLVQIDQVLGNFVFLCNMISTTTPMALKGFLSFPRTLVFGFVLFMLIFLSFLKFTNILGWFTTISLFFTL
jgi:hypothetical protein